MGRLKRILCGSVLLFAGHIWADSYSEEREALDAAISQAVDARDLMQALTLIGQGLAEDAARLDRHDPVPLVRLKAKRDIEVALGNQEQAIATNEQINSLWQSAYVHTTDLQRLLFLGAFISDSNRSKAAEAYKKALAVAELASDERVEEYLPFILYHLAYSMYMADRVRLNDESLAYTQRAIGLVEKRLGSEDANLIPLFELLVSDFNRSVGVAEIERLHKRIIRIEEKVKGPGHQDLQNAYRRLIEFYIDTGRYDEAVAVARPFATNPEYQDREFTVQLVRALMLQGRGGEAGGFFYNVLAQDMRDQPEEKYLSLLRWYEERVVGLDNRFPPNVWADLANSMTARERNAAKGFPYITFYMRYSNVARFDGHDLNLYLDNIETLADLLLRYGAVKEPFAREMVSATLDAIAKHHPEKAEPVARQLASDYAKNGERGKSEAMLAAAEQHKTEMENRQRSRRSRIESYYGGDVH